MAQSPIHRTVLLTSLFVTAWIAAGCQDANASRKSGYTGMVKSSGKFNQGYQEGMREGQNALFDASGAWMWLWMMEPEYKQGYDRGWQDGRRIARLKNQEQSQLGAREPLRPRSFLQDESRDATTERAGTKMETPPPPRPDPGK